MKIYLVGGAVRDQLLGLSVKERDWVVVGATIEEMLSLGYRQVGKDFPVFLHPKTNEEYALARVERKVSKGYTGFTFDASSAVTLEEDLKRRDITINAIAKTEDGQLIDPYGGVRDLQAKVLRHVSAAFAEDPVRILRVGRFAARFASLGFAVAPETCELMRAMVNAGEVNALVAERVWKELERSLAEKNPENFFEVLESCGADKILFPTLKSTQILIQSVCKTNNTVIRFAALCHDQTEEQLKALCDRYRVPTEYRELTMLVSRYLPMYQKIKQLSSVEILQLLQSTDAFRREERFKNFLLTCEICLSKSESLFLLECYQAAKTISAKEFIHLSGKEIAEKITEKRQEVISQIIKSQ